MSEFSNSLREYGVVTHGSRALVNALSQAADCIECQDAVIKALEQERDELRQKFGALEVDLAQEQAEAGHWKTAYLDLRIDYDPLQVENERLLDLIKNLAEAEKHYRSEHDHHGGHSLKSGRAWDLMRRAGDKVRAAIAKAAGADSEEKKETP